MNMRGERVESLQGVGDNVSESSLSWRQSTLVFTCRRGVWGYLEPPALDLAIASVKPKGQGAEGCINVLGSGERRS
jgi:streptogramin lyase